VNTLAGVPPEMPGLAHAPRSGVRILVELLVKIHAAQPSGEANVLFCAYGP
jgi:hypothetical protein